MSCCQTDLSVHQSFTLLLSLPLLFLSLSLSLYPSISLSLSHLRSLSGISSVSRPLSQLLCLTPLQGAQCTFQRSLWWICLNEGTQPSAWINAAPAHQECVKCWPSSHVGAPEQNTLTLIYCHSLWFWRTLSWRSNHLYSSFTQWNQSTTKTPSVTTTTTAAATTTTVFYHCWFCSYCYFCLCYSTTMTTSGTYWPVMAKAALLSVRLPRINKGWKKSNQPHVRFMIGIVTEVRFWTKYHPSAANQM